MKEPSDTEIFKRFLDWNPEVAGLPAAIEAIDRCEITFAPFRFPTELRLLYTVFDGFEFEPGLGILSLAGVTEKRKYLQALWKGEEQAFPPALFPVADMDGSMWFTVLAKEHKPRAPILTLAMGDGSNELELEYESLALMAETILEQSRVTSVNQYPGTTGHYSDSEASAAVKPALNPNMYRIDQKGVFSSTGVQKLFDLDDLPDEWFE